MSFHFNYPGALNFASEEKRLNHRFSCPCCFEETATCQKLTQASYLCPRLINGSLKIDFRWHFTTFNVMIDMACEFLPLAEYSWDYDVNWTLS